jgi:hypothetical protein
MFDYGAWCAPSRGIHAAIGVALRQGLLPNQAAIYNLCTKKIHKSVILTYLGAICLGRVSAPKPS